MRYVLFWFVLVSVACTNTEESQVDVSSPEVTIDESDCSADYCSDADIMSSDSDLNEWDSGIIQGIPRTEIDPDVDSGGHPDVLQPLLGGEVRAGRITAEETGFSGQETDCRPGDYRIYNSEVAFCIASEVSITSMLYSGGQLIDADFVDGENERFFMLGAQNQFILAGADTVEVIADGRDALAVVRVTGVDEPLKIIDDYAGRLLRPEGVTFQTEYRLVPDVNYLEIVTWVFPESGELGMTAGDISLTGDTTDLFFSGTGRERPAANTSYSFFAATGEGRSYGLYREEGLVNYPLDLADLLDLPFLAITEAIGRGTAEAPLDYRRYFILGRGGTVDIRAAISEISQDPVPAQQLNVSAFRGEGPGVGVSFLLSDETGAITDLLVTNDLGVVSLPLHPGVYTLEREEDLGTLPEPLEFEIEAGADLGIEVTLSPFAHVFFEVFETPSEGGVERSVPARILLTSEGVETQLLVPRGGIEVELLPGEYQAVVSRGEQYSLVEEEGLILDLGESRVEYRLERLWETAGFISGEFHQHSTRSFDSLVSESDRLLSNLVEGVDFVVPSDHDAVTDLQYWVVDEGVSDLIYAMASTEVSPSFVHLGAMPMPYDALAPSGGAFSYGRLEEDGSLFHLNFPEIVASLRQDYGAEVIQINHPRANSPLFYSASYDPLEDPSTLSGDVFTADFDTVEVYNGRGEFCQVFDDWVGLVARGYQVAGVGNSDTHTLNKAAGYPRNYLESDVMGPQEIEDDDITGALLSQAVSVSGGAFITFPDGPQLGSVTTLAGEQSLRVKVQTPVWSTVDTLLVILNGAVVESIAVLAEEESVIAFDEQVSFTLPDRDSYMIIVAYGDTAMDRVYEGEYPFGFTNPIFFDVDGVSGWQPPGISGPEELPGLTLNGCDL